MASIESTSRPLSALAKSADDPPVAEEGTCPGRGGIGDLARRRVGTSASALGDFLGEYLRVIRRQTTMHASRTATGEVRSPAQKYGARTTRICVVVAATAVPDIQHAIVAVVVVGGGGGVRTGMNPEGASSEQSIDAAADSKSVPRTAHRACAAPTLAAASDCVGGTTRETTSQPSSASIACTCGVT